MNFKKNEKFQDLLGQVTPQTAYFNRRQIMQAGMAGGMMGVVSQLSLFGERLWAEQAGALKFTKNKVFAGVEEPRKLTNSDLAYKYNNFYEFSLDKNDVAENAKNWNITDWKLEIAGLCKKPFTLNLKDLTSKYPLEERVYRFRCVEAWSMVLPWVGFPLAKLIADAQPKPEAKFVKFTSLADPKAMPNIKGQSNYPWPNTEGIRLDEAQNDLTLLAVGLYGEALKKQNGAPIRLVLPWKYGFKSIKSLVKIEFVNQQPKGLWEVLAPREYGFYANVNPKVDHPRWSQASERVVDGRLFPKRIDSLLFNGYEKEVGKLYAGLDLKTNY